MEVDEVPEENEGTVGEGGRLVTVRLPQPLWLAGRFVCIERHITWSELLAEALGAYLRITPSTKRGRSR